MNTLDISTKLNEIPVSSPTIVNLKEIETKGFVLIRNFLTQDEINFLKKDFNESKARAQNANYPITDIGPEVFPRLSEKVMNYCEEVSKITSTHVDASQGGSYFSVKAGINFPWHQDHESFFINQNHMNYLNFYMIIIKDKQEEANLNVVPFSKLKAKSPEYYNKLIGRGAISYIVKNGETHIYSDEPTEKVGVLPYDIGTLAETPQLNVGDLLLLRGDSIHSTQPSDSARVAVSLRMVNYKNRINLKRMVKGNKFKRKMLTNNRQIFDKIFNAFEQLKVSEASYSDLIQKFAMDNSPIPSKRQFILKLWKLRLRFMLGGN